MIKEKIDRNQRKAMYLHGGHSHDLRKPEVDKVALNAWLNSGELFPETEGYMIAIQDKVVNTRN